MRISVVVAALQQYRSPVAKMASGQRKSSDPEISLSSGPDHLLMPRLLSQRWNPGPSGPVFLESMMFPACRQRNLTSQVSLGDFGETNDDLAVSWALIGTGGSHHGVSDRFYFHVLFSFFEST